jgi:hypothetical protein
MIFYGGGEQAEFPEMKTGQWRPANFTLEKSIPETQAGIAGCE